MQIHFFFCLFLVEYVLLFLDDNVMKNVNNFQTAKIQPQVLLSIYLIFCSFQPGVVYKSVAKKKRASCSWTLTEKIISRSSHTEVLLEKADVWGFVKSHRKTSVLESFSNNFADCNPATLTKGTLIQMFPMNFAKFFITPNLRPC